MESPARALQSRVRQLVDDVSVLQDHFSTSTPDTFSHALGHSADVMQFARMLPFGSDYSQAVEDILRRVLGQDNGALLELLLRLCNLATQLPSCRDAASKREIVEALSKQRSHLRKWLDGYEDASEWMKKALDSVRTKQLVTPAVQQPDVSAPTSDEDCGENKTRPPKVRRFATTKQERGRSYSGVWITPPELLDHLTTFCPMHVDLMCEQRVQQLSFHQKHFKTCCLSEVRCLCYLI